MIVNTALTVYNRYVQTREEKYQRAEISAALWESAKAVSRRSAARIADDNAVVSIPFAVCADHVMPKAWLELADKTGKWTLQAGDVIVRGIVTDEITSGFTLSALRAKYDDVLEITSVERMDQGSPNTHHWQVGCK